ncbi:hypothetical protein BDW62DRAFT_210902 [Aspergillus aurantiobrunneus]
MSSTVLITGAAGGLGKAIATAFLNTGANVAICDVNSARIAETAASWTADYSSDRFIAQQADVASLADIQNLVEAITSKFGRLDILINNAGILDAFDPAGTCPRETWDRVLNVNLTGPYICTQVAVGAMQAQSPSGGTIINMGSNASVYGNSAGVAYTVSKHGVLGLTRNTAAFYLDYGITCTMLQLGGLAQTNIVDGMAGRVNEEGMGLIERHTPGFKAGVNDVRLEDVGKFCVFLADRNMAKTLNGASVPFNRNWPAAV